MTGGDPKCFRFSRKNVRKTISTFGIDHNPLGTLLYIGINKSEVSGIFCSESQYSLKKKNLNIFKLFRKLSAISVMHFELWMDYFTFAWWKSKFTSSCTFPSWIPSFLQFENEWWTFCQEQLALIYFFVSNNHLDWFFSQQQFISINFFLWHSFARGNRQKNCWKLFFVSSRTHKI